MKLVGKRSIKRGDFCVILFQVQKIAVGARVVEHALGKGEVKSASLFNGSLCLIQKFSHDIKTREAFREEGVRNEETSRADSFSCSSPRVYPQSLGSRSFTVELGFNFDGTTTRFSRGDG